jgi:hypothetical protein
MAFTWSAIHKEISSTQRRKERKGIYLFFATQKSLRTLRLCVENGVLVRTAV